MSEVHELEIRTLGHGGDGIGHEVNPEAPRATWFVSGALPGERVLVRRERAHGGRMIGHLQAILQPSAARVVAPCRYAGQCGGCTWQHVDPTVQAHFKAEIVRGHLRKIVDNVDAIHSSQQSLGYRRRARLHYRRDGESLTLGFHRPSSHALIDVERCVVLDEPCQAALAVLRANSELLRGEGELWLVSNGTSALIGLTLAYKNRAEVQAFRRLLNSRVVGIHLRNARDQVIFGEAELLDADVDDVMALPLQPFGFAQAQAAQNTKLVRAVVDLAQSAEHDVLELFCGVGNFTRALVAQAGSVVACDDDRDAIARLRERAKQAAWRCEVFQRSALAFLKELVAAGRRFKSVVLDPPRDGLGIAGVNLLAQVAFGRVVYVSCDPATLARDVREMIKLGFVVRRCEVLDLMPMTPEVEVVIALDRIQQG